SPRKRATTSTPDRSSAVRNGRGSRLPKNEPACVIRKRGPRRYSSPAKSSKSEPLAIVTTAPCGSSARVSSATASETVTTASALERARLDERALDALRPVQLLRQLPPARADEADAVHPRLRPRRQLVVAVQPLRVLRREHVRLDAEAREVRRELERPLDAAAA